MLSDRRQRVLAALIEEYVLHALPVGSRTLVENYRLGVSSATVRSELSVLEDDGYITQPHTSAGRVPTDFGYRSFVDDLLSRQAGLATDSADEESVRALRQSATELDDLLERTTAAVARLTECLSIVLPPTSESVQVTHLSLVPLSASRVLLVVVDGDEQVSNRSVDLASCASAEELAATQEALNQLVRGKDPARVLADIRQSGSEQGFSPLLTQLLEEAALCAHANDAPRTYAVGLPTLMRQPEFQSSSALIPVMQMLEDDAVLMQFFGDFAQADEPVVRIGRENAQETLSGVSVVASGYGRGSADGIIAVIGPTRMDYAQVIRAVRLARRALTDE